MTQPPSALAVVVFLSFFIASDAEMFRSEAMSSRKWAASLFWVPFPNTNPPLSGGAVTSNTDGFDQATCNQRNKRGAVPV
jgi:hypothetical protein